MKLSGVIYCQAGDRRNGVGNQSVPRWMALVASFLLVLSAQCQSRLDPSSPGYYEQNARSPQGMPYARRARPSPSGPLLKEEEYKDQLSEVATFEERLNLLAQWSGSSLRGRDELVLSLAHYLDRSSAEFARSERGKLYYFIGTVHERALRWDSANFYYKEVGSLLLQTDRLNIESYRRRGNSALLNAQFQESVALLDTASFLASGSGDALLQLRILQQKARAYNGLGNHTEAIRLLTECVQRINDADIAQEQKQPQELSFLNELSNLYYSTGDFVKAKELARKGMVLGNQYGLYPQSFNFIHGLVNIHIEQQFLDSALSALQLPPTMLERLNPPQQSFYNADLALVYLALSVPDSALKYLRRAEATLSLPRGTAQHKGFMKLYARYYALNGEYQNAIRTANYSKSAVSLENFSMVKELLETLHQSHFALGNVDSAYFYLNKYNSLASKNYDVKRLREVEYMKRMYERKESDWVIEDLGRRNRLNTLYFSISIAFSMFIIAVLFLGLSNAKRINELVVKESELADQKVLTLLTEQEVVAAESILEGREQQRKILSQQLHDEIGSQLATVKLHLESLTKESEQLQNNASMAASLELVDLIYDRVRSLSHDLNSHLMLSKGLQRSLEQHVRRLNVSEGIKVSLDLSEFEGVICWHINTCQVTYMYWTISIR